MPTEAEVEQFRNSVACDNVHSTENHTDLQEEWHMSELTIEQEDEAGDNLEKIILANLEYRSNIKIFKDEKVKKIWEEKYPDIPFMTPFSILYARNRIEIMGLDETEFRET